MKAQVLVKNGPSDKAFELQELPTPSPKPNEVLVKSEAFGLNFADVMARLGHYQDCPPLPAVIGYENVGRVVEFGSEVKHVNVGDRVVAFTRFGGYADHVVAEGAGVAKIPEDMPTGVAAALATQYVTAWHAAEEVVRLHSFDNILIHAAAGGVGTALIQLAKRHGCTIFGTAGSPEKLEYLREQGVHHPINYRKENYEDAIKKLGYAGKIDVTFNPIGGDYVKKDHSVLAKGGRMVLYGASKMTETNKNPLKMLSVAWGFGIWSPIQLVTNSQSIIGINMLRIADNKKEHLKHDLESVIALAEKGEIAPHVGKVFKAEQLAEAHDYMESRKSVGKIVVEW